MRNRELEALPHLSCAYPVYANRVDPQYIVNRDTSKVVSLMVNFGEKFHYDLDKDAPERTALNLAIEKSTSWLEDSTVYVGDKENHEIFYTINISTIIPDGWDSQVIPLGSKRRQLVILMTAIGNKDELVDAHLLINEDLLQNPTAPCLFPRPPSYFSDEKLTCRRSVDHKGEHQHITNNSVSKWTEHGSSIDPKLLYGFPVYCQYCGETSAGDNRELWTCSTCNYWLDQSEYRAKAFVIGGYHYRMGNGYGESKFEITRFDGTTYSGGLMGQGEIPDWFDDLFPDTAEFTSEQYFPRKTRK